MAAIPAEQTDEQIKTKDKQKTTEYKIQMEKQKTDSLRHDKSKYVSSVVDSVITKLDKIYVRFEIEDKKWLFWLFLYDIRWIFFLLFVARLTSPCQRNISKLRSKKKKEKKHQEKHMTETIGLQFVRSFVYLLICDDTLTRKFLPKLVPPQIGTPSEQTLSIELSVLFLVSKQKKNYNFFFAFVFVFLCLYSKFNSHIRQPNSLINFFSVISLEKFSCTIFNSIYAHSERRSIEYAWNGSTSIPHNNTGYM